MQPIKHRINRIAIRLALLSFVSGSSIFLLYLATESDYIMGLGIFFIILALASNTAVFMVLFFSALVNHKELREHLTAMLLLVLNIPVAVMYLNFLFPF